MPQQGTSADELFGAKGGGSQPPPVSGGMTADELFGGGVAQAPAATPSTPVAKPVEPPKVGGTPAKLTPEEKRSPFWSGAQEQFGLDPDKIKLHSATPVAEGIKQLAQGMSKWMESSAKDPAHLLDPYHGIAQGLEFHVKGHDPFGLKGKVTPIDHIINGFKNNDSTETALGAGGFIATLGQLWGGGKVGSTTSKLKAIPDAFPAEKVLAATNETLQRTADETNVQLADAVKQTGQAIGRDAQNIAGADVAKTKAAGARGSFTKNGVRGQIVQNVIDIKAGSTPLNGTQAVLKALKRYGNDLSWEDLKDIRQVIDHARQSAVGKDAAVLGKSYADVTKLLKDRAVALGKEDQFNRYVETTESLTKHKNGILGKIANADTGLKFYNELAKAQNRPQLNDLFGLLEKNSSIPKGVVDSILKTHEPLAHLANAADKNVSYLAGKLQSLARHPLIAGTAGGVAYALPLPGKFILSLYSIGKAGEIMDRIDAAEAVRKLQSASTPKVSAPPPVAPAPAATAPPTPPAGAAPQASPVVPPPVPPTPAPASPTGFAALGPAQAAPASASSNIIEAMKAYEAAKQAPHEIGLPAERHAELEARFGRKLSDNEAIELDRTELERRSSGGEGIPKSPGLLVPPNPSKQHTINIEASPGPRWHVDPGAIPGEPTYFLDVKKGNGLDSAHIAIVEVEDQKQPGWSRFELKNDHGETLGLFGTVKEAAAHAEKLYPHGSASATLTMKKVPAKAYESFGVKLSPKDWKTPEDVILGKKTASELLMAEVNKRAADIKTRLDSGAITAKDATASAHELSESWKKAQASIDKTKATGVGRAARDRLRKGAEVKEATAEVGRQQATAEQSAGGMDITEAGIEIDQLQKAYKKANFGKVYKDIVTKWEDSEAEGDYVALAKQLREGLEKLKGKAAKQ